MRSSPWSDTDPESVRRWFKEFCFYRPSNRALLPQARERELGPRLLLLAERSVRHFVLHRIMSRRVSANGKLWFILPSGARAWPAPARRSWPHAHHEERTQG